MVAKLSAYCDEDMNVIYKLLNYLKLAKSVETIHRALVRLHYVDVLLIELIVVLGLSVVVQLEFFLFVHV